MFRAYAVDLNDIRPLIKDESATSIYDEVKTNKIKATLKKILTAESPFLDSEKICNLFFPAQSCPVFLSHSGQNKEEVDQFAQWLKEHFEINSFIDSDLWGCIKDLQLSLDHDFCRIDPVTRKHIDKNTKQPDKRTTYSYSDRNISTAHVHMILCHALTQMIDSAECFIFLKSSESYALENGKDGTFSPWIFHKLATVDTIRENRCRETMPPDTALESYSGIYECIGGMPKVFYPIALKRPFLLKKADLIRWSSHNFETDENGSLTQTILAHFNQIKLNDRTKQPTQKWEKALNWLYQNCHNKRG